MLDTAKTGKFICNSLRNKFGSLKKASVKLNISVQSIYRWNEGLTIPSVEMLLVIADALGCKMQDLIIRRDNNGGENT